MKDGVQNTCSNSDQPADGQVANNVVYIQPRKLAIKNGELRYCWPVEALSRLQGLLYSNQSEIKIHLVGEYDDRRRCLVKAHITANLQLECQTSFEPISYLVDTNVVYCCVVDEEQITCMDGEYEALLLDDGQVDIKKVIEDELILALPIAINKTGEEHHIKMSYGELPEQAVKKKTPFTVLKGLNIE